MAEFTSETSGGVSDPTANQRHWNFWKEKLGVPYFSNSTENVVLATIGHTTYLHCLVGNLGDRQVNQRNANLQIYVTSQYFMNMLFIALSRRERR